jgi:hypothetical protein
MSTRKTTSHNRKRYRPSPGPTPPTIRSSIVGRLSSSIAPPFSRLSLAIGPLARGSRDGRGPARLHIPPSPTILARACVASAPLRPAAAVPLGASPTSACSLASAPQRLQRRLSPQRGRTAASTQIQPKRLLRRRSPPRPCRPSSALYGLVAYLRLTSTGSVIIEIDLLPHFPIRRPLR